MRQAIRARVQPQDSHEGALLQPYAGGQPPRADELTAEQRPSRRLLRRRRAHCRCHHVAASGCDCGRANRRPRPAALDRPTRPGSSPLRPTWGLSRWMKWPRRRRCLSPSPSPQPHPRRAASPPPPACDAGCWEAAASVGRCGQSGRTRRASRPRRRPPRRRAAPCTEHSTHPGRRAARKARPPPLRAGRPPLCLTGSVRRRGAVRCRCRHPGRRHRDRPLCHRPWQTRPAPPACVASCVRALRVPVYAARRAQPMQRCQLALPPPAWSLRARRRTPAMPTSRA
mmetsp:Transcript_8834/g.27989  ORF Transcript_8834/g.27989 Transcript_8834/m.27989 type:complete len:284 (+) Transcript_8834:443-1294(+)